MERRIGRLGIFLLLCFVALFVQLNNIQVVKAPSLTTAKQNPKVIAVSRVRGVVLASSIPSTGYYKYQRVYNPYTAVLYAQIVGYDSLIYGKTGIEAEYDNYLQSHTRPVTSLRDLLVNRTSTGNVSLTISTTLQTQTAAAMDAVGTKGSAPQSGAVVVNIKTGAIMAMYGNPTYDPNPLASPDTAVEKAAWTALKPSSGQSPLVSRTFQYGFLPGSTFKTVTSAAVYDRQPALAKLSIPAAGCIPLPQSDKPLCNYGRNGPNGPEVCGGVLAVTLPQSCDTAFGTLGMDLGGAALTAEAQAFGFNQHIPIDLPGSPFRPVLPSTRTSRLRPIRHLASRTSWPPHCRWPWWQPASPTAASS